MLRMRRWVLLCAFLPAWLASPAMVWAHAGAPYPVLLEEPAGPYLVSALADPDVGGGTFYVLVAMRGGEVLPRDTEVMVAVAPQDGHAGEMVYVAQRDQTRYGERYVAEVPFDSEGLWTTRLAVKGSAGHEELAFPVEVTPPGVGWIATVACLLPFAILGFLWWRGMRRQRTKQ
jgi:hypothetical protein